MANIASWNCGGGVMMKKDIIEEYLFELKLNVMFVSEAEIDHGFKIELLHVDGYELILPFKPTENRRCRICAYIRNECGWKQDNYFENFLEDIIVLKTKRNADESVVGLYRQYKLVHENRLVQFENITAVLGSVCQKYQQVIVCGDMNLDWKHRHNVAYSQSQLFKELENWCNSYMMTQLVDCITRRQIVTKDGLQIKQESVIDHIYTNCEANVLDWQTFPGICSDHDLLWFQTIGEKPRMPLRRIQIRDWTYYSKQKLIDKLESADWIPLLKAMRPEEISN
jgi:hypothetical protein